MPKHQLAMADNKYGTENIKFQTDIRGRVHFNPCSVHLRVRFFKKIQDWILKSERIRKPILCFFIKQINPRSLGSLCIKGTKESTLKMDSSVPLTHHDPSDLRLIYLLKKHKIGFRILSDLRIQSWIFLKKHTLRCKVGTIKLKFFSAARTRKIVIRAKYDTWQPILLFYSICFFIETNLAILYLASYSNVSISSNCCQYEAANSPYKSHNLFPVT